MIKDQIVDLVYNYFVSSTDFNGIPLRSISEKLSIEYCRSIECVQELVESDTLSIQSTFNPNIIALEHHELTFQLRRLEEAKSHTVSYKEYGGIKISFESSETSICVYPSQSLLRKRRNLDEFNYKVYSKDLAHGEPQLKPIFFDMDVLEKYYHDPRFDFSFEDYCGKISCTYDEEYNPSVRKEDNVFVKSFGIGFDDTGNRVAVVYLGYLNNLTGEHQIHWKSKESQKSCKILKEYYDNTILGNWTDSRSIFTAVLEELECINELTEFVFKKKLFKNSFSGQERPKEFTVFFSPTLRNYNEFIHLLDKMLSENINKDFFKGQIDLVTIRSKGDNMIEEQKGTLRLLEEWLTKYFHANDPMVITNTLKPFKDTRKNRQIPAHKISSNQFDPELIQKQRELMEKVHWSLGNLRYIFSVHPKAKKYVVPETLDNGKVLNL